MGFDIGLNLGDATDLPGIGGLFGSSTTDKSKDMVRYGNEQALQFDANQFRQKMEMAKEFGINKLSMLGVGNSSASSVPMISGGGSGLTMGYSPDSSSADQRHIAENNLHISDNNVKLSDMEVQDALRHAKTQAALSVGKPIRISNDQADTIVRTAKTGRNGVPFKLANESVLPEQYNHGEAFTTLVNAGVDPRLSLALSGVDLFSPTSWITPFIEWLHQKGSPYYRFGNAENMSKFAKEHPFRTLMGW